MEEEKISRLRHIHKVAVKHITNWLNDVLKSNGRLAGKLDANPGTVLTFTGL